MTAQNKDIFLNKRLRQFINYILLGYTAHNDQLLNIQCPVIFSNKDFRIQFLRQV